MAHLDDEIREQPTAVARLVDSESANIGALARELRAAEIRWIVIAARGSSDNAARYAQYVFGFLNDLPVALAAPSLTTVYHATVRFHDALVVGVSQSGQSPDVVAVLEAARSQGRPTIAVTNDLRSPLARAAGIVLDLHAGKERSVAATKSYTTSLAALALLSVALMPDGHRQERLDELRAVPAHMDRVLTSSHQVITAGGRDLDMTHCTVVGRGLNYGTAFEIALKLKELTGMFTEAYSPADLLHGPIGAIHDSHPVIVLGPDEPSLPSVRDVLGPLRDRGAKVIAVSGDPGIQKEAAVVFPLESQPAPWLTPLVTVLPGQLLAAHLAKLRGVDIDRPGGLTKVTRTH